MEKLTLEQNYSNKKFVIEAKTQDLLSQSVYYKKEVQMTKNSKIVGFLYMSLLLLQDI